ncbi:MAG: hypothetical protein JWQ66_2955, partial [Mucilaginibacter sp.]|nr:hypothetical protein [Mucilaginibacter sp.]
MPNLFRDDGCLLDQPIYPLCKFPVLICHYIAGIMG